MKILYQKGDLIKLFKNGEFDAIAHGCNCVHTMGAGIALYLNTFTDGKLLEVDIQTPYGDINKLGTYSKLDTEYGTIYNIYTQYVPVHHGMVGIHWDSLENGLIEILKECYWSDKSSPIRVGIPLIGCGFAGGKVNDLTTVLEKVRNDCLHLGELQLTVVDLP